MTKWLLQCFWKLKIKICDQLPIPKYTGTGMKKDQVKVKDSNPLLKAEEWKRKILSFALDVTH